MNVVRPTSKNINEDDEEIAGRESIDSQNSLIGERMISQFFHEDEGPDRDWSEPYELEKDDIFG